MLPLTRSLSASLASGLGSIAVATALFVASGDLPLTAQPASGGRVTVRSDVQEADAENGTVTARGNVEIDYPDRKIRATAAQAQLFQNENRLVLSGNVVVVQEENRIRAERVVYLIEENRFVATPKSSQQVQSVYVIPASDAEGTNENAGTAAPAL